MTRLAPIEPLMPPLAPLAQPHQNLAARFHDPAAPGLRNGWYGRILRLVIAGATAVTTIGLLTVVTDWLAIGGLNALEYVLIALVGLTFGWISLSVSMATLGLMHHLGLARPKAPRPAHSPALDVALLIPIYSENPVDVAGNAAAMIEALAQEQTRHRFSLFILSDTQDTEIAAQEYRAVTTLAAQAPKEIAVHYRRRALNTDRKVGNLSDWVTRWGGTYDGMLVLDADSLMSGPAITRLSDALAADPAAGLIQSGPQIFGAHTLFGRIQQFANVAYGGLLAQGLALWSRDESNYWGHNAILRTRAFAAAAGLPKLRTLTGRDSLILSHDFVEAALLRRAGWAVRFLPEIQGSYEETPATLVDFALRDRRWCHGNMQHLRLLGSAGFHPVSRFHLMHGAISYLLSPAWFVLLTIWALLGNGQDTSVIRYFSDANPLYPDWPQMSTANSLLILLFMYAMLMVPKLMGMATVVGSRGMVGAFGGPLRLAGAFLAEALFSIAYAPIMMVQQTVAVMRSLLGLRAQWTPQQRQGGKYALPVLFKFHLLETVSGVMLVAGMAPGLVSLWLLPIAFSLVCAVPLSALSGVNLPRRWLATPDELTPPRIIRRAYDHRAAFGAGLTDHDPDLIAAE